MPRFIILHRPEEPEEEHDKKWETKESSATTMEMAIRNVLTDDHIINHEFEIHEVDRSNHSDAFHMDGIFDDIYEDEEYGEKGVE